MVSFLGLIQVLFLPAFKYTIFEAWWWFEMRGSSCFWGWWQWPRLIVASARTDNADQKAQRHVRSIYTQLTPVESGQ